MKILSDFSGAVTPQLDRPNSLPDWVLDDFRGSGIPDTLTEANIRYAEDVEALLELGLSHWSPKSRTETTRAKAQAIASGIWFTYGTTIEGEEGPAIYAKPRYPRQAIGFGKQSKSVKYETRYGDRATPILPWIDSDTAAKVCERWGIEPAPYETFWQAVLRCNCPIVITEGLKKALALMERGIPAIALRGVSCWNVPQSRQLHEVIAQFATPSREWAIAFDQDIKPKTVRNVSNEIRKLGAALEGSGGKVRVLTWSPDEGKGIDDAMVAQPNPDRWLQDLWNAAPTLSEWKRDSLKASLLAALERQNIFPVVPERITTGRYLPELPPIEPGVIFCLDAPMGTGKTYRIGADWVQGAVARGWNVLVLSPANALGQQTAERWGLPHIHDYDLDNAEQSHLFKTQINHAHGLVLCPDSLLRVPHWFWNSDRPLLVVFDEANQVVQHIVEGGTLGKRQSVILERLTAMLERAAVNGAIVLSEADLLPKTLNWVSDLSGCQQVRYFCHQVEADPWQVELLSGSPTGYVSELKAALDAGNRIMLVTSSQLAGKRIDLIAQQWGKQVLRIDSETNEKGRFAAFWRNPNHYLTEQGIPDLLILSPSGKSGVSIEIPGFDAVWGYFTCLSPSTWLQQLGRYRLPVPRRVFAKPFIPTAGDESLLWESEIRKRLDLTRQKLPKLLGLEIVDLVEAAEAGQDAARLAAIQQACEQFYIENSAAIGAEKAIALDYLKHKLRQHHCIVEAELSKPTQEISAAWHNSLETIWRTDAEQSAAILLEAHHTADWAHDILDSPDSTRLLRQTALKVLYREEFPGVDFDSEEECYQALFKDFGAMRRGVTLQARAENLDWSRFEAAEAAKKHFDEAINLTHRLPKTHMKALLLQTLGLLKLLDGRPYSNADLRAQEIRRRSLHYASDIRYYLGINVAERQTPCEICNKLLRRLGLEAKAGPFLTVREGDRKGRREWIYTLPQLWDATRIKLLRAATQRLTGAAAAIPTEPPPEYTALTAAVEKRRRKPKEILEIEPEILQGMGISVPGDGAGGVDIQGIAAQE